MTVVTEETLGVVPDSPSELFEFNRELLIQEAIVIAEITGAGIVPIKNKVPKQSGWQHKTAKNPEQIREALSQSWVNGAGVLLPADKYCVVDTDTAEAEQWAREELPETFTVQTLKGYHRYYSVPGPIKQDRSVIRDGVDVLTGQNYAVYVGSVHPDTEQVEYRHTDSSRDIESLPASLYERLKTDAEGKTSGTAGKAISGASTASVEVSESASKNAEDVIARLKPQTRARLNDTSDGRDGRVYSVVLSLLQSGCGGVADVMAVLLKYPLRDKVLEQPDPWKYLSHKVRSAQEYIAENPAQRMTLPYWRRLLSGASLKAGYRKVLQAIGYMAFTQSKEQGRDVTRLTLSQRDVALGAGMSKPAARKWINQAVDDKFLKKITDPSQGSGYATVYLLTVPRTGDFAGVEQREVTGIDVGHDAFRHGALASALPVFHELHYGPGSVKELHERMGGKSSVQTTRNNLNKLKDADIAENEKKIWKLTEDYELKLDVYAIKAGTFGKREQQKEQNEIEREFWGIVCRNRTEWEAERV
ncbi:bifunctional DNA primase/polymerase [Streptomyces sp. SAS_270]|uniref:bifunctional DNA primase/polymerase n=1 Tax=Streptomyces sp. SAS_270 TaxID=3412748 RepID=UPI00403D440F